MGVTFTKEQLDNAVENNLLLNLQIAIPCACLNDCIYCFQASGKTGKQITLREIFDAIGQVKELGALYVQILGKGEPLLSKDFLKIVEYCNKKGIYVNLFTCGDVLGDDDLARKIHGMTGVEMIERLKAMDISLFVKYEMKNEDSITNRKGYSEIRNRALERLIAAGFNATTPTRLGITPVIMNKNYGELRGIYAWALKQNIYPHLCVLISTGKTKDVNSRTVDVTHEQLISLAIDALKESIDQGYEYIGPTPFPGGVTCEYLRIGLYLDDLGDIFLCSGRDSGALGNIREKKIKDVWLASSNARKEFINGHGCPWKERDNIIPANYYGVVDKEVKKYLEERKSPQTPA